LLVSLNDEAEAEFVGNSVLRKRTLSAFIGASDTATGRELPTHRKRIEIWKVMFRRWVVVGIGGGTLHGG
jgi:hypothetical protein